MSTISWVLAAIAIALALVGFSDDKWNLSTLTRFLCQVVAGAAAGYVCIPTIWSTVLGAVMFVCLVNAVNFMDGINGITGMTLVVWGCAVIVYAHRIHSHELGVFGAVAIGAALGFLPANIPHAILFLGDIGSYLFGSIVAIGTLLALKHGLSGIGILAPMAVYLLDTGSVLLVKAYRRQSLFAAHRDHIYQRLVNDCGLSHFFVAVYIAATSAMISVLWLFQNTWYSYLAMSVIAGVYMSSIPLVRGAKKYLCASAVEPT